MGEILDREVLPFLYAALSGHQCLGRIHAGRPDLAIWRPAVLAHAGGLSEGLAERLVRGTIDLLVKHRALLPWSQTITESAQRVSEYVPGLENQTCVVPPAPRRRARGTPPAGSGWNGVRPPAKQASRGAASGPIPEARRRRLGWISVWSRHFVPTADG